MMWFARARRQDTGEIVELQNVAEIHGEPDGQIRPWINEPDDENAWKECDLELYTGFVDYNKRYIYEGDEILLDGNLYLVIFNQFLGQWVIDGDAGQAPLWEVAHKCYVTKEMKK